MLQPVDWFFVLHLMIAYFLQGCVDAIIDKVSDQIGAVAGISVTVLVLMVSILCCVTCVFEILHKLTRVFLSCVCFTINQHITFMQYCPHV